MSTTHTPTGWNTWDFAGFNRLVYLRRGETVVTVEFAVWDEAVPARVPPPDPEHRKIGKLYSQFRWEDVVRLGPHAPLGLPSRLEFRAGEVRYTAEATERDGTLDLQVRPDRATAQRVVFRLLTPVGAALVRKTATRGTFAGCEIRLRGATWPTKYFVNIAEPYAVGAAGRPAAIRVRPAGARAGAAPGTFAALERQALAGEGALADAPGAMMQAICWNTLFDTRRRLVSSPVSRDWCSDWRGVLVFCWDTYLVATFMSYEAPELSRLNIEAVTAAIAELGFVPNYYMAHGAASRDRSMPPLGTYLVWKLFVAANGLATARSTHGVAARGRGHSRKPRKTVFDRAWLASLYPLFVRWHGYWLKNRAGAGTGLLSWGSNPVHYEFPQLVPYNQILQHTRQSAMYESGLDNSPLFDEAAFDAERNCLTLEDVMLSSLYAMDCEALAHMAAHLGRRQDAARLRREYGRIAELINERLWDEHHGLYVNRHWPNAEGPLAGRYSSRWAPTSFFPMIAGVATPARAARMVREHLLNPQEFWGTWVIPSVARSDPAYKDNDYWRGRIWGPFNFLVSEGLRRYRFDAAAAALARKSLDLFMRNWRADGGVYENYNAETGQGADVWNAARLYHWGGLLAFVALQELIDIEPNPAPGWLRLGSLDFPDAALRNVRLAGDLFAVTLDQGVHARRNGRPFIDCTTRALVRVPLAGPDDEALHVTAAGAGRLTLHEPGRGRRPARLPDGRIVEPAFRSGRAIYEW